MKAPKEKGVPLMAWEMKVEDSFRISGKGVVVTGRPDTQPVQGPAKVVFPGAGTTVDVQVIGIERFMKLPGVPIPGDNVGLLLGSLPSTNEFRTIPRGSIISG
jgi:translation elongation factor EF-Tu-like GTPase